MLNKKEEPIKLTEKDCLVDLRNQCVMQITQFKVELAILKGMPEDFIVGEKGVSQIIGGMQGKVSVKAKEAMEIKLKQIFSFNKRLEAIDALLAKE